MENVKMAATANDTLKELKKLPSRFEGRLIAFIGINLLTTFVSVITLGFAYPAMYCFKKRWIYANTIINGYRLKFTGKGSQLFGKYMLWTFLGIITFGVFTLWWPIKYQQWETNHVEIDSIIAS